jgi:phosphoglucosamine mutase
MDVFLLGPMPTPSVAMLTRSLRADLGVMISASHNPYQDNGIKFFGPDGFKLSDEIEKDIERPVEATSSPPCRPDDLGRAKRIDGAQQRYIEFAKRTLPREMSLEGLRIVIDCANGAAYKVAPEALWELGADVVTIGVSPDGFNINKDCGSTSTDALSARFMRCAPISASRSTAMRTGSSSSTRTAPVIDGDQLMAVVAQSWQAQDRLTAPGIVATVMSNLGLERYLDGIGLNLPAPRWATATWSSTCARTATMSAASSPAISSCPTSSPPATA